MTKISTNSLKTQIYTLIKEKPVWVDIGMQLYFEFITTIIMMVFGQLLIRKNVFNPDPSVIAPLWFSVLIHLEELCVLLLTAVIVMNLFQIFILEKSSDKLEVKS
jgi:hypothetical protein